MGTAPRRKGGCGAGVGLLKGIVSAVPVPSPTGGGGVFVGRESGRVEPLLTGLVSGHCLGTPGGYSPLQGAQPMLSHCPLSP